MQSSHLHVSDTSWELGWHSVDIFQRSSANPVTILHFLNLEDDIVKCILCAVVPRLAVLFYFLHQPCVLRSGCPIAGHKWKRTWVVKELRNGEISQVCVYQLIVIGRVTRMVICMFFSETSLRVFSFGLIFHRLLLPTPYVWNSKPKIQIAQTGVIGITVKRRSRRHGERSWSLHWHECLVRSYSQVGNSIFSAHVPFSTSYGLMNRLFNLGLWAFHQHFLTPWLLIKESTQKLQRKMQRFPILT